MDKGRATFRDVVDEIGKLRSEMKTDMKDYNTELRAEIASQINPLKLQVSGIEKQISDMQDRYVLKTEIEPVKRILNLILVTVVIAVVGVTISPLIHFLENIFNGR